MVLRNAGLEHDPDRLSRCLQPEVCSGDGGSGRCRLSRWCMETELPEEEVVVCGDDGRSDASMWGSGEDTDSSAHTSESEWEWDADSQADEDYEPASQMFGET